MLLLFVHFLSNISGLDLVRMQQGNPRVWLTVMGFVHIETKDPSKWLKKRKKKTKTFIMKKFFKHQKSRKMNFMSPSTSVSNHKLMNSLV